MTKLTLLSRAAATAAAGLLLCAPALALPAAASAAPRRHGAGEETALNLGSSSASSSPHVSTGGASLVRTIVGLAIVIAVIWGLSWILRQVKAGRDPQVSAAGLSSVAALQLGSGRSVHLIKAGNEYVLLGSAEHGLVPIHRYSEAQARDAGLLAALEQEPEPRKRGALLAPRPRAALPAPAPAVSGGGAEVVQVTSSVTAGAMIDKLREWTVRR